MTTQELRTSKEKTRATSRTRLTPLGRAALKMTGVTAAVGVTLFGVGDILHNHAEDQQIAANKAVLQQVGAQTLHSTIYLGESVNVRKSMDVNNGDQDGTPDNIKFTVGRGAYKNKIVVIGDPLHLTDSAGHDWYAFEKPNTDPKTLQQRAKDLVYVAVGDILTETNSADKIVINPNKDGKPIIDTPVFYEDGGFHRQDNDQLLPYELLSTTIPDIGK